MALLDDLMAAYQNAGQQITPLAASLFNTGSGSTSANLQDALSTPMSDSVTPSTGLPAQTVANMPVSNGTGAPMGFGSADATPQQAPSPAPTTPMPTAQTSSAPPQNTSPAPAPTTVDPGNVATVNAGSGFPSPSDYNADGSQASSASGGGLLGALAGAGQQAAADPDTAKGLLSMLGDKASEMGQKLKSMSPAASQALIATGMTMLAGNDGTRNLSQLVGMGGVAGANQYQAVTQNQMQAKLAQQKLIQEQAAQQATNATANYNATTERTKALNTPISVAPGNSVTTVGQQLTGQAPTTIAGPNGALPVKDTVKYTDANGNSFSQGVDMYGNKVGQPVQTSVAYTGPLNDQQQKIVNDAQTQASKSAQALNRTQMFMTQLTPTIPDPNNPGQTIPNPAYTPVTGGVGATVANELNKITGGQTQSQMLRQEINQNIYMAQLGNWKPGVGGRLTNADITLLKQGMPPDNASGTALQQYLQSYAHLQEDQATRDATTAQYVTANRGDMSPLHGASTIAGQQYQKGASMQQVLSGQSSTNAGSTPAATSQQAQTVVAQAQAAARSGDAGAQAALKQRGLSW